jgi:YARHG domain
MTLLRIAVAALAALISAATPRIAQAGCYEALGCTAKNHFASAKLQLLDCMSLGFLRNSIFAEKGYCFRKPEYRQLFANRTCRFDEPEEVPLTGIERANVRAIYKIEEAKNCPN